MLLCRMEHIVIGRRALAVGAVGAAVVRHSARPARRPAGEGRPAGYRPIDQRMLVAFQRTGLGWLRGQIRGLDDVGLVNLRALIGDPGRLDDARCLPKLAGSNPTERSSGKNQAPGGSHRL